MGRCSGTAPTVLSEYTHKKQEKSHRNLQVSLQKAWLPHQEPKSGLMLCGSGWTGSSGTPLPSINRAKPRVTKLRIFISVMTYRSGAIICEPCTTLHSKGRQVHRQIRLMLVAETQQVSQCTSITCNALFCSGMLA